MSEQSIRDELADFIEYIQTKWEADRDEYSQPLANFTAAGLLASPVIRRIQAEAAAGALRDFADRYQEEADYQTPADIDPDLLRKQADQIESATCSGCAEGGRDYDFCSGCGKPRRATDD